jgi:monoterpene epsilon-lactone hydrolase
MPTAEFDALLADFKRSQATSHQSVEDARSGWESMARKFPPASDLTFVPEAADGVPVEWVSAPGVSQERVLLYMHGGGYVLGSIPSYREFAGRLSRAADARVLLVGYRLAPEHPFPAAVDDAVTACRWLARKLGGLDRVAVAGDSAGGGLALAMLLALKDSGHALTAAVVCISPSTDLGKTGESIRTREHLDPIVTVRNTKAHAARYLGVHGDARNPLASPLYGALQGLPPLLILVGTNEILYDDSTRLADKARGAGVQVTLDIGDGMVHIWPYFAAVLPEGREAIERIGAFIRERTEPGVLACEAARAARSNTSPT